jgi:hypothetical protein
MICEYRHKVITILSLLKQIFLKQEAVEFSINLTEIDLAGNFIIHSPCSIKLSNLLFQEFSKFIYFLQWFLLPNINRPRWKITNYEGEHFDL